MWQRPPSSATRRSASSTRCRSRATSACRNGAPSAAASTATAGSIASKGRRPHPDRARDGRDRGRRAARRSPQVRSKIQPENSRFLSLGTLLLGAAVARAERQGRLPAGERAAAGGAAGHRRHRAPRRSRAPGLAFRDYRRARCRSTRCSPGAPVVVTLGYHRCPMLCGLVLDGLVKARRRAASTLGRDYTAVVDQHRSRRGRQARAANQHGGARPRSARRRACAPRGLAVLVSRRPTAAPRRRAIADAVGFRYKYDEQSEAVRARGGGVRADARRRDLALPLRRRLPRPRRDRLALVEASGGRVGTSFDKVLLSCYRYDPVNRTYAPFVFAFMRIGAGLVFLALAGLLTILWRKELAMRKASRRAATADANDMSAIEDRAMRKSMPAARAGVDVRGRVDHLHYFVITVTMIASSVTGLLAFAFFFKYRERRPKQSTPIVIPSVRFEIVVIGVPLFFFLLWFVQGYKDYVWYTTPPGERDGRVRHGQEVDVEVLLRADGPNAIGTLHVPANRPVRLLMTSRDVIHSFYVPDFRIKQDVLPGRYTETWFEATKPGRYQILCAAVLRHLALADVGRGRGHGAGPSSTTGWPSRRRASPSASTPAATTAPASADRSSSTASRSRWPRAASSATRSTASRTSARPGSTSTAPRDARERRADRRRRGLPHRLDDRPARQDREGLQARHADLQGAARGARGRCAGRVHQVAAQPSLENVPSKEAVYEPVQAAR